MNDFLKQFSNDSYKKNIENKTTEKIEDDFETNKEASDDTSVFKTQNTKEEIYVRDDEKIKNRKKKTIIGCIIALIVLIVGGFGYYKINEIRVPSFVEEKTLNDVQVWAAKNKIELNYTYLYSVKVNQDYIIKQSIKAGETLQKNSNFDVIVSKGANLNDHIKLPDFMKMSLTDIEKWKEKEKASNVSIEKVFSEDVEKAKTIRFEFISEGISKENYRRKDKLKIYVSKGKEEFEKNIEVPNFKNKSKGEVESWATENEITVDFIEQAHDKIMEGNVISQNIEPKTKIAKKDKMIVVVSRGKISYAPNYYGLDETQAQVESSRANVVTNVVYYYSDSIPTDRLISQSIPAGTEVSTQTIVLTYSLGKPYILNFDGQDVYTMIQSINDMNKKGANLSYQIDPISNSEKKGTILTSNYKSSFVNIGSKIIIAVSSGK